MVGLVFVSHSARLAEGVLEFAGQMTQGAVRMAAAGGIDDPDAPIGTDAMKVLAAIDEVYSDEGVVILIDLGSALLSTEVALEFLDDERRPRVHLCPAPLVEGAVIAATEASGGSALEAVRKAAEELYG